MDDRLLLAEADRYMCAQTHIDVISRPRDLLRVPGRRSMRIPHIVALSPPKQSDTYRFRRRPRIAWRQLSLPV